MKLEPNARPAAADFKRRHRVWSGGIRSEPGAPFAGVGPAAVAAGCARAVRPGPGSLEFCVASTLTEVRHLHTSWDRRLGSGSNPGSRCGWTDLPTVEWGVGIGWMRSLLARCSPFFSLNSAPECGANSPLFAPAIYPGQQRVETCWHSIGACAPWLAHGDNLCWPRNRGRGRARIEGEQIDIPRPAYHFTRPHPAGQPRPAAKRSPVNSASARADLGR